MTIKIKNKQIRSYDFQSCEISENKELIKVNFSSETPYPRFFGEDCLEIIGHNGYMNLERLNNKAIVLFNHNWDLPIGVVERAWIENDRGYAEIRLSSTACEYAKMIEEKILTKISFGYEVTALEIVGETDDKPLVKVYNTPFEISFVSVPADDTVGVLSRSGIEDKEIEHKIKEMFDNEKTINKINIITKEKGQKMDHIAILELGKKYNELELANDFAMSGKSMADFQLALLEKKMNTASKLDAGTKKELNEFSFGGYLAEVADNNAGKNSGLAKELTQDALRKGYQGKGGIILPKYLINERAAGTNNVTTAAAFGNTASENFRTTLLDALYNNSVYTNLATNMGTFSGYGSVTVPIINSKNSVQMLNEGSAATPSRQETGKVTFTPKTAKATSKYTRELSKQTSLQGLESIVLNGLVKAMAEKKNSQFLNGTGTSGEVLGLFNVAGTNAISHGTNGGAVTYAKVVEFESAVADSNAELMRCGYATNTKVVGALKTTQKFTNYGAGLLEGDVLNGYQLFKTNEVTRTFTKGTGTNLNGMLFANADWVHVGEWDQIEFITNPFIEGDGAVRIEAFETFDVQVSRPNTISVAKDIIA